MKKGIGHKLIIVILFIFVSSQFIYPSTINAEVKLNWGNPNQGRNPYKFRLSDYLNSQMMMQVVGCTGVVNKVSGTMGDLMRGDLTSIKDRWESNKAKIERMKKLTQEIMKALGVSMLAHDPGPGMTTLATDQINEEIATKSLELENLTKQLNSNEKADRMREECLNGIAYTLAKNQLTAMTKQTINWVTSGFNGDPMYVRNINNFVRSIEDEILYKELDMFKDLQGNYNTRDYPYARDISRSMINSQQSANNFANSMRQDLTNYLIDGATIEEFSNDFSKGGWYGYLGLTQHSQNNPLGATMETAQYIAEKQAKEVQNTKDEIRDSGGMLSDKRCVVKASTKKAGQIKIEQSKAQNALKIAQNNYNEAYNLWLKATTTELKQKIYYDLKDAEEKLAIAQKNAMDLESSIKDLDEECAEWEVVTPGSLIRDKISSYLGSPERQLEMADSINEVLNVLFAKLIDKLRLDGLTSLNSESYTNLSGGVGSNWTTPIRYYDIDGNIATNKYAGNGLDENRAFDLTKDLGNIYNRSDVINLGTWDANINKTTPKNGPSGALMPMKGQANTYYEVSVAGKTKLFPDDVLGWEVGDRAFFDGSYWQNWKCKPDNTGKCTDQMSPVAKKGIIQIQKDYIVIAKELLKVMPAIMPALGELDYCIPGPNPNWQVNSSNAYEAFAEYVSGLEASYYDRGSNEDIVKPKKNRVNITEPSENKNSSVYKNYENLFVGSPTRWYQVHETSIMRYMRVLANSSSKDNLVGLNYYFNGLDLNGDWIDEEMIMQANSEVAELIQNIFESLDVFNKEYPKTINETYGTIQQQFIRNEKTGINIKNPKWIPMAQDGLTLTKKMISYDEEITNANMDIKDAINEADSVINKLELIRRDVSKIIKDAQDRRDKTITEALNKNGENYGTNYTAYKKDYAQCLNEENIDYLDYTDLVIKSEKDNCTDGFDNDFDGFIDSDDTDCIGSTGTGTRNTTSSSGRRENPYSRQSNGY